MPNSLKIVRDSIPSLADRKREFPRLYDPGRGISDKQIESDFNLFVKKYGYICDGMRLRNPDFSNIETDVASFERAYFNWSCDLPILDIPRVLILLRKFPKRCQFQPL